MHARAEGERDRTLRVRRNIAAPVAVARRGDGTDHLPAAQGIVYGVSTFQGKQRMLIGGFVEAPTLGAASSSSAAAGSASSSSSSSAAAAGGASSSSSSAAAGGASSSSGKVY